MCEINIFLDDCRVTPKNCIRTYTVEETIELLKTHQVNILSLDNDLGDGLLEGRKVLDWIEEQVYTNPNFVLPNEIRIHSANAVAKLYMANLLNKLYKEKV